MQHFEVAVNKQQQKIAISHKWIRHTKSMLSSTCLHKWRIERERKSDWEWKESEQEGTREKAEREKERERESANDWDRCDEMTMVVMMTMMMMALHIDRRSWHMLNAHQNVRGFRLFEMSFKYFIMRFAYANNTHICETCVYIICLWCNCVCASFTIGKLWFSIR